MGLILFKTFSILVILVLDSLPFGSLYFTLPTSFLSGYLPILFLSVLLLSFSGRFLLGKKGCGGGAASTHS